MVGAGGAVLAQRVHTDRQGELRRQRDDLRDLRHQTVPLFDVDRQRENS